MSDADAKIREIDYFVRQIGVDEWLKFAKEFTCDNKKIEKFIKSVSPQDISKIYGPGFKSSYSSGYQNGFNDGLHAGE